MGARWVYHVQKAEGSKLTSPHFAEAHATATRLSPYAATPPTPLPLTHTYSRLSASTSLALLHLPIKLITATRSIPISYLPNVIPNPQSSYIIMTRSHKQNDRDHAGLADGTAAPEEHLPRYFAKAGFVDADPKKTKKNGGGKGNWGVEGEEVADSGFTMTNERRRSNSSSYKAGLNDFKTKFEQIDAEPVFEEDIHGAQLEEDFAQPSRMTTESSESGASIDEEEKPIKA